MEPDQGLSVDNKRHNSKMKHLKQTASKGDPHSLIDNLNDSYAASIERAILNCSHLSESTCNGENDKSLTADILPEVHLNNSSLSETSSISISETGRKFKKSRDSSHLLLEDMTVLKKFKSSKSPCKGKNIPDEKTENEKIDRSLSLSKSKSLSASKELKSAADESKQAIRPDVNASLSETFVNGADDLSFKQRTIFPKRHGGRKKLPVTSETGPNPFNAKSKTKSILVNNNSESRKRAPNKLRSKNHIPAKQQEEDSPKKKVKFEATPSSQLLDLASANSIEALTELVRQKRIRPPYGQPYSVTGAWYVASGYLKDLAALLELFEKKPTARFLQFSQCWQEMCFSQVYRGRESFKELLEFSEEIVVLTKKFLENVHSDRRRIGALYTLYGLYYKHPVRLQFNLRFTTKQYSALAELVKRQPHLENPDPARILNRLQADSAIHHTARDNELCIGLHTSYNNSNVCVEYGYLRLAQSSSVPRALPHLDLDDRLMQEYHSTKTAAAGGGQVGPERALNLFNSSCSRDIKEDLLRLEDFTLNLLSFRGQHAVQVRSSLGNDPILTLGTKRYSIRKRATSIAAAEAHQLLTGEQSEQTNSDLATHTLLLAAQMPQSDTGTTKYIGKIEYGADQGTSDLPSSNSEPLPSSSSVVFDKSNKSSVRSDLGHMYITRKRGRPNKYLNLRNKIGPTLPLGAAQIALTQKVRRDRLMAKLAMRSKVNYSLDVKNFKRPLGIKQEKRDTSGHLQSEVVLKLQPDKTTVVLEPEALFPSPGDEQEGDFTDLGDSVGGSGPVDCDSRDDGHQSADEGDASGGGARQGKDSSMLNLKVQLFVNDKREIRNVAANVSEEQFQEIKKDPARKSRLHQTLLTMMLPKLQGKHGVDCEVRDLSIVSVRRCKSETMETEDFFTGNQPFVKSGKCNIKLRMRMMEKYQKKTPVAPKVEEVNIESSNAKVQLVPICVGSHLRYIQSGTEDVPAAEDELMALPSSTSHVDWSMNSVLRSHNCNWTESKKISKEFSTYKYQLNAAKLNTVKMESVSYNEIKKENLNSSENFVLKRNRLDNVAAYKPKVVKKERVTKTATDTELAPDSTSDEPGKPRTKKRAASKQTYQSKKQMKKKSRRKGRPVMMEVPPATDTNIDLATTDVVDTSVDPNRASTIDPLLLSTSDEVVSWHRSCEDDRPTDTAATDQRGLDAEVGEEEEALDVRRMELKSEPVGPVESDQEEGASISVRQMEYEWGQEDEPDTKPVISVIRESDETGLEVKVSEQLEVEQGEDHVVDCNDVTQEDEQPADHMNDNEVNQCEEEVAEEEEEKRLEVDSFIDDASPAVEYVPEGDDCTDSYILMETNVPGQYVKVPASKHDGRLWPDTSNSQYFLTDSNGVTSNSTLNTEMKPLMDSCGKLILSDNGYDATGYHFSTAETYCLPGIPQSFPMHSPLPVYPSTSMAPSPVLVNPSHSPYLSNASLASSTSFFSPTMGGGSYIRAHTQDGAELLLPSNTCFTIVDANGSETNSTELQFNGSPNPIMIRSQPVLQPQHSPAFMPPQPHLGSFVSVAGVDESYHHSALQSTSGAEVANGSSDQAHLPASPEFVTVEESTDRHMPYDSPVKETLLECLNLKPSPAKRTVTDLVNASRRSTRRLTRQEAGLSPGRSTNPMEFSETSYRSRSTAPTPKGNSPTKTKSSPTKSSNSPTKTSNSPTKTSNSPTKTSNSPTKTSNSPTKTSNSPTKTSNSPTKTSNSPTKTSNSSTKTSNSPTKASNSPTKASNSPTKASNSPTKASNSPTKASNSPTKASSTPIKASNTFPKAALSPSKTPNSFNGTPTQYSKTSPSKSASNLSTAIANVSSILSPGHNKPLVTYSSSPMKSPIVHYAVSAGSSSVAQAPPFASASPGLTTNKRPVCSFLVTRKFKPLQPALGSAAAGAASGKPPPSPQVYKPRVSFFRKGSLGSKST